MVISVSMLPRYLHHVARTFFFARKKRFCKIHTKGSIPFLYLWFLKMYRFKVSIKYLNLMLPRYLHGNNSYCCQQKVVSRLPYKLRCNPIQIVCICFRFDLKTSTRASVRTSQSNHGKLTHLIYHTVFLIR